MHSSFPVAFLLLLETSGLLDPHYYWRARVAGIVDTVEVETMLALAADTTIGASSVLAAGRN